MRTSGITGTANGRATLSNADDHNNEEGDEIMGEVPEAQEMQQQLGTPQQQVRRIAVPVRHHPSTPSGGNGAGNGTPNSRHATPHGAQDTPGGGMNGMGSGSTPGGYGSGPVAAIYAAPRQQAYASNANPAVIYSTGMGPMLGDYGSGPGGYRVKLPAVAARSGGPVVGGAEKSRGLRHFSNKVCEKVKEKGQTNYNEVADELVVEYFDSLTDPPSNSEKQQYEMKNIRRRVYDALNVLMAMNIIEKEKKEIRWVGLPTSSLAECRRLEEEKAQRQERLRVKTEQLQELIIQLVAYKSLVQRNRQREREDGRPPESAILYLPYIIVNTDRRSNVECRISSDKTEYWFNFDSAFEIHDDIEVLKRLGLSYGLDRGEVPDEHVDHIKSCLPMALRDYIDQIIEGSLTGGVLDRTGKGSHTVSIPTNQLHERKPTMLSKLAGSAEHAGRAGTAVAAAAGGMGGNRVGMRTSPMAGGYGISGTAGGGAIHSTPAGQATPGGGAPVARYAVIPRTISAVTQQRYGGTAAGQLYRTGAPAGQRIGASYVTMAQPGRVGGTAYLSSSPAAMAPHRAQRYSDQQQGLVPIYAHQVEVEGDEVEEEYLMGEEVYDENLNY